MRSYLLCIQSIRSITKLLDLNRHPSRIALKVYRQIGQVLESSIEFLDFWTRDFKKDFRSWASSNADWYRSP